MILFFYGEDSFSLLEELKKKKAEFLQNNPQAVLEELEIGADATEQSLKERLGELLQSQGLFAQAKLIILYDFLSNLGSFPQVESYLLEVVKAKVPSEISIIFVQRENFDKCLSFFKSLKRRAKIKEFVVPTGKALEAWIGKHLEREGFKIERLALERLFAQLGENYTLWQIEGELMKLMLYCWENKVIKVADVSTIVPCNITQNVFDLTNLVAEGQTAQAISLLEQMVSLAGVPELKNQVIQIVGALASQIRSLLLVKDLERESPSEIAKILDWNKGRVWINLKLAKNFSKVRLICLLSDLKAIDKRLKTSEEPPKLLLSLFFQKANPSPSLPPRLRSRFGGQAGERG